MFLGPFIRIQDDLRELPQSVRVLLVGGLVNLFGNGLVLPYTFIYLHNVRHISFPEAGTLLGIIGILGLLVTPIAGPMIDRFGAPAIVMTALTLLAAGYGSLAAPLPRPTLIFSMALAGMGNGLFWPAQKAFLALAVPPDRLHIAFAFGQLAANLGMGLGALFGSLAVALAGEQAIAGLFAANAVSFVLFAAMMVIALPARRHAASPVPSTPASGSPVERATEQTSSPPVPGPTGGRVTTLTILRNDAAFRLLILVQAILVTCGYAADEQLPVFLTNFSHVAAAFVGIIFLANIVGNVVAPIPLSRYLEGRDRLSALRACLVIWAALWVVIAISTSLWRGPAVIVIASLCSGLFAVGEAIEAVTVGPLVGALASEETMGRYMAGVTTSWNVGLIISPIIGGVIMQWQHRLLWPIFALVLLAGAALAPSIRVRVPAEHHLVPKAS